MESLVYAFMLIRVISDNSKSMCVFVCTQVYALASLYVPACAQKYLHQARRRIINLSDRMMDRTQLQGEVPVDLFSLSHLQTVLLRNNTLNGTLDIGPSYSNQLQLIDLQNNLIDAFMERGRRYELILVNNPVCALWRETKIYCIVSQPNYTYLTPPNNCTPNPCSSHQKSSPTCRCAYPYSGKLVFKAPSFSDLGNSSNYVTLQKSIMSSFQSNQLPVDSVSLSNPRKNSFEYLELSIDIFPSGQDYFNRTGISQVGFLFTSQNFRPPHLFGIYVFSADQCFAGESTRSNKSSSTGIIIGAAAGGSVLLLLLVLAGAYAYRQKKTAQRATKKNNPFAHWDTNKGSGTIPQLKGPSCFSFEELKKYTNNFSDANEIGSGGYGKVYRGTLPTGQQIAVKRAQQESMQGALEFKTEIELLSRVHHKNVVSLLGFCFEQGEEMLIYEYVPNGSLKDCLSGKSVIRLDWMRRLKVALGAARGLAYLHELANPPIIHRDIKSNNILLDGRLNAKISDFGLSKSMGDNENGEATHVTTLVKGTRGYLDPEYYITQHLTEKSDVYSFGVLMVELITARKPIERGIYIVKEIKMAIDKTKDLYNLQQILDPDIGLGTTLKGFEQFVDVAMKCLEEMGVNRPTMGEVVKEIEIIMQLAGLNPNAESASTSASYGVSKGSSPYRYSNDTFEYSGAFTPSN